MRQRLVDEEVLHHNAGHVDECTLNIYYLCYSDWDRGSYVFINDSTTATS